MIVNKPVGNKSGTQAVKDKKKDGIDIDINSLDRLKKGVAVAINQDADAWVAIDPPPAGYFTLVPAITKDGIKGIERTESVPESMFFKINLELKIQHTDREINGSTLFANVSTYIGRGKELSTALGIILKSNKRPKQLPNPISDVEQVILINKWLKNQPLLYGYCDWQAWSKEQQKVVRKGMENFPQDEEGKYSGTIEVEGESITATMKVVNFVTPGEYKKVQEELAVSGKGVTEEDIPVEVEVEEKPKQVVKAAEVKKTPSETELSARSTAGNKGATQVKNKQTSQPAPTVDLSMETEESGVTEDDAMDIEEFIDDDTA